MRERYPWAGPPDSPAWPIPTATAQRKAQTRPSLGTVFHGPMPRRAALKIIQWPRINLASANVPGPPQPLYLAGAPLTWAAV